MEVDLQAILDVLNAWADADLEALRATRDELAKQVLPRLPKVLPPVRRRGEGPRAMRQRGEPR